MNIKRGGAGGTVWQKKRGPGAKIGISYFCPWKQICYVLQSARLYVTQFVPLDQEKWTFVICYPRGLNAGFIKSFGGESLDRFSCWKLVCDLLPLRTS